MAARASLEGQYIADGFRCVAKADWSRHPWLGGCDVIAHPGGLEQSPGDGYDRRLHESNAEGPELQIVRVLLRAGFAFKYVELISSVSGACGKPVPVVAKLGFGLTSHWATLHFSACK